MSGPRRWLGGWAWLVLGLALLLWGVAATGHPIPPYSRAAWMPSGWDDADRNCRDTRQEVLLRHAALVTLSADGCRVIEGRWIDWYTGEEITDPSFLDIDHVVPLKRAHEDGGWAWSPTQKRAYANDLSYRRHLVAVSAQANRAKGARGPEYWRPPDRLAWCRYAEAWSAIKVAWGLRVRPAEQRAITEMLATC